VVNPPQIAPPDARTLHRDRARAIVAAHPEVRRLIGRNRWSFGVLLGLVSLQVVLAAVSGAWLPWWGVLALAWCVGAFANHGLYVMIHEATHDRIFTHRRANMLAGIVADLPNVIPAFVTFRNYHIRHHIDLSGYDGDADVPSRWEVKLVGHGALRKALWLLLFPVVQSLRPPRLKGMRFFDRWVALNWVVGFGFDALIWLLLGPGALLYLFASFYFAISLHPLGARWIQEHFQVAPPQQTYSYYGPMNRIAFNIGYHNEHHDLPSIPWNRLPRLRAMAPEFYDPLVSHRSWTALVLRWIFDRRLSLESRPARA